MVDIPISQINAYAYCPRRFYYEFVQGEMIVNEFVLEGQQLHERVDQPGSSARGQKEQLRRVYLCAPRLGLVGYSDLLEIEENEGSAASPANAELVDIARAGKLYPVEYKKGKMGKWISDHAQLCAQALAVEEALGIESGCIATGYLFYIGSARRDKVEIDERLRNVTLTMLKEARVVMQADQPPAPITNWRKCRDCSLEPICLPREVLAMYTKRGEVVDGNSLSD